MKNGDTYEYQNTVKKEYTADALGSGGIEVFSTPYLVCWMEAAAHFYLAKHLPDGQTSVGTLVNISHLAPSPVGASITTKCELESISENGKIFTFKVWAYDNCGLIGEGTHQRAVIDAERFMKKARAKLEA